MGEIQKAVGQWIVSNVGWTVLIILFILSMFFEISKIKKEPIGSFINLYMNDKSPIRLSSTYFQI